MLRRSYKFICRRMNRKKATENMFCSLNVCHGNFIMSISALKLVRSRESEDPKTVMLLMWFPLILVLIVHSFLKYAISASSFHFIFIVNFAWGIFSFLHYGFLHGILFCLLKFWLQVQLQLNFIISPWFLTTFWKCSWQVVKRYWWKKRKNQTRMNGWRFHSFHWMSFIERFQIKPIRNK